MAEEDEIRNAFQLFDPQGTGRISVQEVREALEDGSARSQALLKKLPSDVTLNLEQFSKLLTQRHDDELNDMERMFVMFDTGKKGYISLEDLQRIAGELGETMTTDELQEMIGDSGRVNLEQFATIMNKNLWT